MTGRLVTLGETMVRLDSPITGPLRHAHTLNVGVAGAESNVAIGFQRLDGGAAWIGRTGDDEFGRLVRMVLAGEGVDVSGVIVDPAAPTALLVKERRSGHLTRVQYYRSGSAGSRLSPEDVPEDVVRAASVLHVTGITLALSETARAAVYAAVETARSAGVPVSFDLNYRSALWGPAEAGRQFRSLLRIADIVFATEPEARLVADGSDAGTMARALSSLGPPEVLIKRGALGAVGWCNGVRREAPAHPVDVVDPVGAGDAFAAAYLAERQRGCPVAERLDVASVAGAYAVTVAGDWEGLPSREDLAVLRSAEDAVQR